MSFDTATSVDTLAILESKLCQIVGPQNVHVDEASLDLFSHDIGDRGNGNVNFVVAPRNLQELSAVVANVTEAGFALAPRGAGMSYTAGYVPSSSRTVALDMQSMSQILAINAEDMTVTVQAGCSWSQLYAALKPLGLRTPFWGPMSGIASTIGGGVSQLNAMLGAGHYGTSSESVVAMTVVLADGRIVRTGARGSDGQSPFYRHFGPDVAGLFCGDCGSLGIKAEVTLRLIRTPAHEGSVAFSFPNGGAMMRAMAEIARAGLAAEMCAFDPGLTEVRMRRESMASDLKKAMAVASSQKSMMKGFLEVGRMALAGRKFLGSNDYSLHLNAEGRCAAAVDHDLAEMKRVALSLGGKEVANTIAKVIRAQPFPVANSILGPEGERWLPIHGQVSLTAAPEVLDALEKVFSDMSDEFQQHGIHSGFLFTSLSTNAIVLEPVLYWPDERFSLHESLIEPEHLSKLPVLPPNPEAHAVALKAKAQIIEVFRRYGSGHFQIGRTYPYRSSREESFWELLQAIKKEVDPKGLLNPGVLGLNADQVF